VGTAAAEDAALAPARQCGLFLLQGQLEVVAGHGLVHRQAAHAQGVEAGQVEVGLGAAFGARGAPGRRPSAARRSGVSGVSSRSSAACSAPLKYCVIVARSADRRTQSAAKLSDHASVPARCARRDEVKRMSHGRANLQSMAV